MRNSFIICIICGVISLYYPAYASDNTIEEICNLWIEPIKRGQDVYKNCQEMKNFKCPVIPAVCNDSGGPVNTFGPPSETVTVSAKKAIGKGKWLNTGIYLETGSILQFKAKGKWKLGEGIKRECDADGITSSEFPLYNGERYGTLMGKIGEKGTIFKIGKENQKAIEKGGTLFLGNNDTIFEDNEWNIEVSIWIE